LLEAIVAEALRIGAGKIKENRAYRPPVRA
jgi:hypothetical protein